MKLSIQFISISTFALLNILQSNFDETWCLGPLGRVQSTHRLKRFLSSWLCNVKIFWSKGSCSCLLKFLLTYIMSEGSGLRPFVNMSSCMWKLLLIAWMKSKGHILSTRKALAEWRAVLKQGLYDTCISLDNLITCKLSNPLLIILWIHVPYVRKIKAAFSEKNFVPQPQFESASMLTALDPSIISRESMHKNKFGQTLKLQSAVVTVNISSRSN